MVDMSAVMTEVATKGLTDSMPLTISYTAIDESSDEEGTVARLESNVNCAQTSKSSRRNNTVILDPILPSSAPTSPWGAQLSTTPVRGSLSARPYVSTVKY